MTNATTILPKLIATLLLIAAAGAALLLTGALPTPPAHAQTPATDYDANDNGLIDINSIAKLNAIRYDLDGNGDPDFAADTSSYLTAFPNRDAATSTRMGCPAGQCAGYELTDNLAFATSATWTPIGIPGTVRAHPYRYFGGTLDGNGHTITGLDVSVTSGGAGLFVALYNNATIRDLGLINPAVSSNGGSSRGALAGFTYPGVHISGVYAAGGSVTGTPSSNSTGAGGLVGSVRHTTIQASYSSASVSIGGSYTAGAEGGAGGLVGRCRGCTIIASYAAGAVTGTSPDALTHANFGGLVANSLTQSGRDSVITNSYCDSQTGGPPACIGSQTGAAVAAPAYTTAQLQQPTGYTGIYLHWNISLDGNATPDHPWNFGASSEYPTLNTPAQRAVPPPATDYDATDNGLIDIDSIAQLNALRWDLDGNGDPDSTTTAADYNLAFPNRAAATSTRMGCPAGQCAGYELTDNLAFATSATWTPIGTIGSYPNPSEFFSATLDGAGYTITGLTVTTTGLAGLFMSIASGATVRDLGLINASIAGAAAAGTLAASADSGALLTGLYASGGSVASSYTSSGGSNGTGGLVGDLSGHLYAAWSTAAVSSTGNVFSGNVYLGGLVGHCEGCHLAASYAAGAVTSTSNASVGGLAGRVNDDTRNARTSVLADNYCNPAAAGLTACIGSQSGAPVTSTPYTAAQLQTPTGYTGIYQNWNIDLDLDDRPDYPWNFGTSSDYPTLNTPTQRAALAPAPADTPPTDYDANDNGLIEINSFDQLKAIRGDLDGNGDPDIRSIVDYRRVFPNRDPAAATRMGCPGGACAGYELTATLGLGNIDWTPIPGDFNATLDGRGHTIQHLIIEGRAGNLGLFRALGGSSTVRNLQVRGSMDFGGRVDSSGLLAGVARDGARIYAVSVRGQVGGLASSSTNRNAGFGGLVGTATGATIQASYGAGNGIRVGGSSYNQTSTGGGGGLVGRCLGCTITASYVVGNLDSQSANARTYARLGGLVGYVESSPAYGTSTITDSYCYSTGQGDNRQLDCIGHQTGTPAVTAASKTRAELREPTGYTGIYQNWNLDLDGNGDPDDPWIFPGPPTGGHSHAWTYPSLRNPYAPADDHDHEHGHDDDHDDDHDDEHDDEHAARPPADDTDYNPAADHPEIYANDRYEMAATCQIHRNADGEPTGSTITFDLGTYEGEVLLALTLWNGDHFASYERMDAAHPTLNRNGQTATIQVATTPSQTRFLLDGRPHGLRTNLLLGYADCHTDDPGAESPPPTPTPTPTPEPPRVYRNAEYEMTATCTVTNESGNPETAQITFDLGDYEGEVTLRLSLWDGEYYTAYESHGLTQPNLERNGQTATVQITTDPSETVFLLNTTAKPTRNLLLGHADCHTAGG